MSTPSALPSPPAIFVGRNPDLERLRAGLLETRAALVVGVGGAGKTSLICAALEHWPHPVVFHALQPHDSVRVALDDVRRRLAGDSVPELIDDQERVEDIASRLDELCAVLVVDDLHHLGERGHAILFERLMPLTRRGMLVATSRELYRVSPRAPYRLELRLEGLDPDGARALWSALDRLYGPSAGFDQALERTRGIPFLLRRAHAGNVSDEDPAAAAVAQLSGDEREVAASLALSELPLSISVMKALWPSTNVSAVIRNLVVRMVISVDAAGLCTLHDLFRAGVRDALSADEKTRLHQRLAEALVASERLDEISRARFAFGHLMAAGQFDRAAQLLQDHRTIFVRQGRSGDLLSLLDSLPEAARTDAVRLLRIRTLGRLFQVDRALLELRPLLARSPQPDLELTLASADLTLLSARLDESESDWIRLLEAPNSTPAVRLRAGTSLALIRSLRGRGDEARRLIDAALEHVDDPFERGVLQFSSAFSLWVEGRFAEAEAPMQLAFKVFHGSPATYRGQGLFPIFATSLLLVLGRVDEAERMRARARSDDRRRDLRIRVLWRTVDGTFAFVRGQPRDAIRSHTKLLRFFERGGERLWALWMKAWLAMLLLWAGRLREATVAIDEVTLQMRAAGCEGGVLFIERVSRGAALLRLKQGKFDFPFWIPALTPAFRALEAVHGGDEEELRRQEPLIAPVGLPRALFLVARAIQVSRHEGVGAAEPLLAEASAIATQAAADAELCVEIFRALAPSIGNPQVADVATEIVVDQHMHVLRIPGRRPISFVRRPVLRYLLYTLAARPGERIGKEQLVTESWNQTYNPASHDNVLRVNVRRLRVMLAGSPLSIESDDQGYRLIVQGAARLISSSVV